MARKNINVSEIVHERLSLRKRKEETFDDVLKRELGILPSGIGDLVAFYPERFAQAVDEIVALIEEQADLDQAVAEYEDYYALEYDHPKSGHTIVQIQFRENPAEGIHALYRDHHGEMQTLVEAHIPEDAVPLVSDEEWEKLSPDEKENLEETYQGDYYPVYVGPTIHEGYEGWHSIFPEEVLEPRLESKITGSYQRWG